MILIKVSVFCLCPCYLKVTVTNITHWCHYKSEWTKDVSTPTWWLSDIHLVWFWFLVQWKEVIQFMPRVKAFCFDFWTKYRKLRQDVMITDDSHMVQTIHGFWRVPTMGGHSALGVSKQYFSNRSFCSYEINTQSNRFLGYLSLASIHRPVHQGCTYQEFDSPDGTAFRVRVKTSTVDSHGKAILAEKR